SSCTTRAPAPRSCDASRAGSDPMLPAMRIAALVAACLFADVASAHVGHASATRAGGAAVQPLNGGGTKDARQYFTDTMLRTQDDAEVRFFSDVLHDRVVVLNVIYTSCKDACPLIT